MNYVRVMHKEGISDRIFFSILKLHANQNQENKAVLPLRIRNIKVRIAAHSSYSPNSVSSDLQLFLKLKGGAEKSVFLI